MGLHPPRPGTTSPRTVHRDERPVLEHSLLFLVAAIPFCLFIVVTAAAYFVRGAVSIAHRLSVPEFLVGSVIVAVGTSAPEVAINVSAVVEDAGDIVISNIVGSNIVNIALGVGIAGLILSFDRARSEYTRTIVIGLLGAVALLANTLLMQTSPWVSSFTLPFALALLTAFAYFMWTSIRSADGAEDEEFEADAALIPSILFILLGAGAMAFFSDKAVIYAVELAQIMAIPEAVVGATVIAAGGSLPEVSACIAAARIGRPNLILGNVAGSQIFNILGILGLSGVIGTFTYSTALWVDIAILIGMTLILIACLRRMTLRRFMGPLLVGSYGLYAAYLVYMSA